MRPAAVSALAVSALLVACASPAPPPAPPPGQNWVLLAPPDDPAVMALLDNMERLPDSDDPLPQTAVVGLARPHVDSLEQLFEQTKRLPSADERARYLVEKAVMDDQPVSQWREVRRFSSQDTCERVLRQLQVNTTEMDRQTEYRVGMRLEELEWPVMALSFGQGRCVQDVG